jgi:hypothetical protein
VIPLTGWAPDADPTTPGILRSGNFALTKRGIGNVPSFTVYGSSAPSRIRRYKFVANRQVHVSLDNFTLQTYAPGGVFTNVSRAAPAYAATFDWDFDLFGDTYFATSTNNALQWRTTGLFQDLLGAPQGAVVVSMPNFLFLFNTTDQAGANLVTDRWWCSSINNPLGSWTPSVTTQATNGRLIGNGGAITAALPLGDRIVAYKETSIFVGTYVGSPEVWRWEQIPGEIGTRSINGVVDVGGAHFIVGRDNIWLFDGTRPVAIGRGTVRDTLFKELAIYPGYGTKPLITYEPVTRQVFFRLHEDTSQTYCYDVETQRFSPLPSLGWSPRMIPFREVGFGVYDSAILGGVGGVGGAQIARSERLGGFSFTTGTFGTDKAPSQARQVRVVCTGNPAGSTLSGAAGASQATLQPSGSGATASTVQGVAKFDVRQTGRWHQFSGVFPASTVDALGIDIDLAQAGKR